MAKYSFDNNIYPERAPYQPSRSALRSRFGSRAIRSYGPDSKGRPGDASVRTAKGFTDDDTWRSFFSPRAVTPPMQPVTPSPTPAYQPAPATFYNEQNPFGTLTPQTSSGSSFVSKFGYGSVRSTADMRAGRNAPQNLSAWDAFLKSPAPASPPATSMDLLPAPRAGAMPTDYSATPTADGIFSPRRLSIGTGVLDRLSPSPWEEPI